MALARLCGAKAWLHVQDFEVDAAFSMGLLRGERIRRLVSGAESWLMRRFDVVTTRVALNLRKGQAFVLDKPSEQVDEMVCRVVEIKHGTHEAGQITMTVVEDIYSMPTAA